MKSKLFFIHSILNLMALLFMPMILRILIEKFWRCQIKGMASNVKYMKRGIPAGCYDFIYSVIGILVIPISCQEFGDCIDK